MLPSARRRKKETAARESAGESLWTKTFDHRARTRIESIWSTYESAADGPYDSQVRYLIADILRTEGGWQVGQAVDPEALRNDKVPHEVLLDILASVPDALDQARPGHKYGGKFAQEVNVILHEHRIAYKFVEGELVEFESDELLKTVIEPALKLLIGDKFKGAHAAYLAALKEHDPGDAITDAGTALQETLTALGCRGNALGPLIKDAKKNGLLAGHDQTLIDGISKFMEWASADRSESGDGHKVTEADRADAWLMIHIVGALIVRLADGTRRGSAV